MKQKVYMVHQQGDDDIRVDVFRTKEAATKFVNSKIDKHNDETGSAINHIIWPERLTEMWVKCGADVYSMCEHELGE